MTTMTIKVMRSVLGSKSFWKTIALVAVMSGLAVPEGLAELIAEVLSEAMTAIGDNDAVLVSMTFP
ncbi:hypothetical protein [Pseudomonas sp. TMW22080]|uniref:hypothetical protein n=1 Tax=Pseudomonas sp. TMW22080 TaxID=2506432 RepID=UPI001F0E0BA0|nr:hypothetical protein [Pseudomonas sp. TMW22080]MCH4881969.1 hypothetical protein [Pseudomonas sp. TMW22080]